jgi:GNAT superfamily N-acetyltransferase
MAQLTIRAVMRAEAEDAYSLIEEYYEAIKVVARDDRTRILDYISDAESCILLAYDGSTPVGCILYRPLPHMGAAGEVKRLYVRPQYRQRGIAKELLKALEAFARSREAGGSISIRPTICTPRSPSTNAKDISAVTVTTTILRRLSLCGRGSGILRDYFTAEKLVDVMLHLQNVVFDHERTVIGLSPPM